MQKSFNVGEKLFFDILIICLISFIFFKIAPVNEITFYIGCIISFVYFGINFYMGYKYNLKTSEALIVGIMGCGVGLFLSFFVLYANFILKSKEIVIWMSMPYIIPTKPLIELFIKDLDYIYIFQLMMINILLVIFGSFTKRIMNKILG